MIFTEEQIKEIGRRLTQMGVKDTDLPDAGEIIGEEIIAIVQDGTNKKTSLSQVFKSPAFSNYIQEIISEIIGDNRITISSDVDHVTYAEISTVTITVKSLRNAESIKIYRKEIEEPLFTGSGNEASYTDTFTPANTDDIIYYTKVEYNGITQTKELKLPVSKKNPRLLWSADHATYTIGEQNTLPTLSYVGSGYAIGYRTSNTEVAEFDANNNLIVHKVGNCTVTAYTAGNEEYASSSASYTLTVLEQQLPVLIGAGPDYSSVTFQETEYRGMPGNMHLVIPVTKDDYAFIKIDKNKDIHTVTTDNENPMWNSPEYFDEPIVDGEYKYYKRTTAYLMDMNARLLVVN